MSRTPPSAPAHHGGDLAAAERRYGRPAEGWLDLSTGINPRPYPFVPDDAALTRLPDGGAMDALRAAAAAAYGVADAAWVVPAPGTQALIQWLPVLRPRGRVAVLGPTYDEHARAWRAAGHDVREVADLDAAAGADVVVAVNPNNPDGRTLPAEALAAAAGARAASGGLVVVDGAFADVAAGGADPSPRAGRTPGLVVLRSFGKFFGLAGVRLGFALAPPPVAAALADALGPWAVSGPAVAAGVRALRDADWIRDTRAHLAADAARLDALLAGAGLSVVGGTSLFRLAETPGAARLCDHLGARGILVRRFPARTDWLRFGLPGNDAGWNRLAAALGGFEAAA